MNRDGMLPAAGAMGAGGRTPWGVLSLALLWVLVAGVGDNWRPGDEFIRAHLALSASGLLRQGELWQPVTALLVHDGFMQALINGLLLWVFGRDLEREWRRTEVAILILGSGLGAGLVYLVLAVLPGLAGAAAQAGFGAARAATFGVLTAFGLVLGRRPVMLWGLLLLSGRALVLLIQALVVLALILGGAGWGPTLATVSGAGWGWLMVRWAWWRTARRAGTTTGRRPGPKHRFDALEGLPDDRGAP